jgi:hypothetical protein
MDAAANSGVALDRGAARPRARGSAGAFPAWFARGRLDSRRGNHYVSPRLKKATPGHRIPYHRPRSRVALLAAAVIAVPIFKRIGLGSVLGYLVAGIAIGPFGLRLFTQPESILSVAELGVVMLLFIIVDGGQFYQVRGLARFYFDPNLRLQAEAAWFGFSGGGPGLWSAGGALTSGRRAASSASTQAPATSISPGAAGLLA